MSTINILPPATVTAASVVNFSAGTTSGNLGSVVFSNSNGVSFGLNGSTITASAAGGGGGGAALSAGTQSVNTGTVVFSNSNGITFGMSGSSRITASHNGITQQSTQPVAVSGSNGSFVFSTLSLGSSNGAHFYTTNGSIVASYTVPTVPPETPFGVSAGTQSVSTGTLVFSNSNGITFGMSGSSRITASHDGLTSQSNQQLSLFAVSNTTQSSSGTADARSVSFAGAGIASVGVTGGTVVVSVPAGGGGGDGGVFAGVSTAGNTAGSTGTVSTGNFVLVGTKGITLSQSTGAAGSAATVSIIGEQITRSTRMLNDLLPGMAQSSSSLQQNSLYIHPFYLHEGLSFSNLVMPVVITASSSANSGVTKSLSYTYGLYSRHSTNSTILTLHQSSDWTAIGQGSSNVDSGFTVPVGVVNSTSYSTSSNTSAGINNSSLLHGARYLMLALEGTLSKGEWWFGVIHRTASGGGGANSARFNISNLVHTYVTQNALGIALNSSNRGVGQFAMQGVYSTSTTALPNSINQTQIRGLNVIPIVYAVYDTA